MSTESTLDPDGPAERITFRTPEALLEELEATVDEGLYANRSEAIRSAIRELVSDDEPERPNRGGLR